MLVSGLLFWLQRSLVAAGNNDTKGVTSTATSGQAQEGITRTTPIQPSTVAVAAPKSTLQLLVNSGARVARTVLSSVLPVSTDRRQSFGNTQSAAAANSAPLRPDYRQAAYSLLKPR